MKELLFATHNVHKTQEARAIVGNDFIIKNLYDVQCFEEIPETADTLQGNALLKAQYLYQKFNIPCFSDDTGLEIEALNNKPGVFSARYAGEHCSFQDNMNKVLLEMQNVQNRKACFKTVIALILNNKNYFFEGKIEGVITQQPLGNNGFGYDPIFLPLNHTLTFAQLSDEQKNKMSHRALAMEKMCNFLKNL